MGYQQRTKSGMDFYEVASLLQKSLRRGDSTLAARAANELFPQFANYTWNRLMTVSAEDCAGVITHEVVALYDAWVKVNEGKGVKDKGRIFIAKAVVLLAQAKHSRDADALNILVSDRLPDDHFMAEVQEAEAIIGIPAEQFEIPRWVYDVHTRRGKQMGMTKADFLRDEEAALTNSTSMYANLDKMIASPTYVEPEFAPAPGLFDV